MTVLENPSGEDVVRLVNEGMQRKQLMLVVGECRAEYEGRSSSLLGWGERVLIIKADRTVLLHQPRGRDPVNWQPANVVRASSEGENLAIQALRLKPREALHVVFRRVRIFLGQHLSDREELQMLLTEEELHKVLLEHPEFIEPGLRIVSTERNVQAGVADFTGYDAANHYVVIEVKKDAADEEAVKQTYRYVSDMKKTSAAVRGVLVAPALQVKARRLAAQLGVEYKKIDLKTLSAQLLRRRVPQDEVLGKYLV